MTTSANIGRWQFSIGSAASPQVLGALEEVTDIGAFGLTNDQEEATSFDSPVGTREFIAGLAAGDNFEVTCNFIPTAANQIVALAGAEAQATRSAKVTYVGSSPNKTWSFSAVCLGYKLAPSVDGVNQISFQYRVSGSLTRA